MDLEKFLIDCTLYDIVSAVFAGLLLFTVISFVLFSFIFFGSKLIKYEEENKKLRSKLKEKEVDSP